MIIEQAHDDNVNAMMTHPERIRPAKNELGHELGCVSLRLIHILTNKSLHD